MISETQHKLMQGAVESVKACQSVLQVAQAMFIMGAFEGDDESTRERDSLLVRQLTLNAVRPLSELWSYMETYAKLEQVKSAGTITQELDEDD